MPVSLSLMADSTTDCHRKRLLAALFFPIVVQCDVSEQPPTLMVHFTLPPTMNEYGPLRDWYKPYSSSRSSPVWSSVFRGEKQATNRLKCATVLLLRLQNV